MATIFDEGYERTRNALADADRRSVRNNLVQSFGDEAGMRFAGYLLADDEHPPKTFVEKSSR